MKLQKTIIPSGFGADPFFSIDAGGHIKAVNYAAEKITGLLADDFTDNDFTGLFTEPGKADEMLRRVFAEGIVSNFSLSFCSGNGGKGTDVVFNAFCDAAEYGESKRVFAIANMMTGQKESDEESFQKVVKEIADYKYALDESSIVAITDQKGIIKYVNNNFCKISKYSAEELIGQDHRIINSGYHPKEYMRNLWVTIANGSIWKGEFKNKAKDGSYYWVDSTIIPFLNEHGKPYQYMAIRADITRRKQGEEDIRVLNEELEKRVKERTEELESFSYSVSHDLRAPLRAVNGYAKILEEDYNGLFDNEGKRLLREVQHNAKKMGTLIDDLLAFSRLGRKEIEKSIIDMNQLTEVAIKEINQTITHHAEIKFSQLLSVMADYPLMKQVLINLISNAVKYSYKKEKPVVEIQSKHENGELIYSISDNGVGFDMQYAHKLFGVFQRLHAADEFPGTGVGLAMVQQIIKKHKGRIWAEGKIDEGATFYFTLLETS